MSNPIDFGARGDGATDDTQAIQHAVDDGEGFLEFPPGDYLVTKTIRVDLTRRSRIGVVGSGGTAKLIMAGAGPAFHLVGSHGGTADPGSFTPEIWQQQRMPTIRNLEIEGRHAEADGIELTGTMQAIVSQVALRGLRHGIHLTGRNRNPIISECQIYHNRGAGVFLDGVNLHQINIIGNHISYNRLGGVRIERSEVRNLQITGNDIEYNNDRVHELGAEPTAEIFIDTTADGASVNEIAIASNTIQATPSCYGANIRIIEAADSGRPPGLWTIAGNIIGSQTNNVHLTGCYGLTISGNSIYSCQQYNMLLESCRQVVLGSNIFRRHTPDAGTGVRLVDSNDCVISGCQILDEAAEGQSSGASLLELNRCRHVNLSGCSFVDGAAYGVYAEDCRDLNVNGCTIYEARRPQRMKVALCLKKSSAHIAGCRIGRGTDAAVDADETSTVNLQASLVD